MYDLCGVRKVIAAAGALQNLGNNLWQRDMDFSPGEWGKGRNLRIRLILLIIVRIIVLVARIVTIIVIIVVIIVTLHAHACTPLPLQTTSSRPAQPSSQLATSARENRQE